ncbi:MotA/TolQ/ExbB proton channel family protein (plasmid) [Falsihalocynthiibacter sp. SS001]|uniref:MotA/TolQ/ExbB proton channel family protein n=1 Tax=Falsihalocynthiibacter sp. SS001 TaxID=3349698 RepID=UPI0036D254FA
MIARASERLAELVALGGPVVAILLALSVLALACVVWKAGVFWIEGIGPNTGRGFAARTLAETRAARANTALGDLRTRAHARLDQHFTKAATGLRLLDVVAQIAPLLGLFGTVLGMIAAFRTLQEAGGTADPAVLAGGIWVALVTTAAGLVVAMPASVALNWFDAQLDAHRTATNDAIEEILTPNLFADNEKSGIPAHA